MSVGPASGFQVRGLILPGTRCSSAGWGRVSPQVNDHKIGGAPCEGSATARPDCRPRRSPIVCSLKFVSILTLGGVVAPTALRDYFVARQDLAGFGIRQSFDPTVPRAEIDPG